MNKLKLGLMAMAAVTGIGSSLAFNRPKAHTGTIYYAVLVSPGQSKWTVNQPGTDCDQTSKLACTITSTSSDVTSLPANTFPSQFTRIGTDKEAYSE